jgi:nitrite reductase (NADH) small subunit
MSIIEQTHNNTETDTEHWVAVCRLDQLIPGRGVAALIDGVAIAVFRSSSDHGEQLFAISNVDPKSGASVMSRGLMGSIGTTIVVASPMFKHRFDVTTGECVDDPSLRITIHPVRVSGGTVEASLA